MYDEKHWARLKTKRKIAVRVMAAISVCGDPCYAYGSVARGDVHEKSDVDIVMPLHGPIFRIEEALTTSFSVHGRLIVQATPSHVPKGYILLNPEETEIVSFPLAPLMPREEEFYRFGGLASLSQLRAEERVLGVNKQLRFILPNENGHEEKPLRGREPEVASALGISIDTVMERVRVLSRRKEFGRTGVFVKYYLKPAEGFEEALKSISKQNRYFSRVLTARGML